MALPKPRLLVCPGAPIAALSHFGKAQAPHLAQALFVPPTGRRGATTRMKLLIDDRARDLSAAGVFVTDAANGKAYQGRLSVENGSNFFVVELPIEASRQPGEARFSIAAADEAGNIRNWNETYEIQ